MLDEIIYNLSKVIIYYMNTKKINEVEVEMISTDLSNLKSRDGEIFKDPYCNIYCCATKKSGKSVLVSDIVRRCVAPGITTVHIYCPTHEKDPVYDALKKWLKKKNVKVKLNTSLFEDDGKTNNFKKVVKGLVNNDKEGCKRKTQYEKNEELLKKSTTNKKNAKKNKNKPVTYIQKGGKYSMNPFSCGMFGYKIGKGEGDDNNDNIQYIEKPIKKKGKKYDEIEDLFIFDDVSDEIKRGDSYLTPFMKKVRHTKSRCIVSSQQYEDIPKGGRAQIDNMIILGKFDIDKLKDMYKNLDISVSQKEFIDLYNDACREKYNFLLIDRCQNEYRKNFNSLYEI